MIGTNTRRRKVAWCAVRDDARGVCVCMCMYGMLCVRACTRALHVQFAKHMKWKRTHIFKLVQLSVRFVRGFV